MAFRGAASVVVARIFKLLDSTGFTVLQLASKTLNGVVGSALEIFKKGWVAGVEGGIFFGGASTTSATVTTYTGSNDNKAQTNLAARSTTTTAQLFAAVDTRDASASTFHQANQTDVNATLGVSRTEAGTKLADFRVHIENTLDGDSDASINADEVDINADRVRVNVPGGGGTKLDVEMSTGEVKDGNGRQFIRSTTLQTEPMLLQKGSAGGAADDAGYRTINFPQPYSSAPEVTLSPTVILRAYIITDVTATTFTVRTYDPPSGNVLEGGATRFTWSAYGPITL